MTLSVARDHELHHDLEQFLFREAELLDARLLHEWFALLSPQIVYQVPIRITTDRGAGRGFGTGGYLMNDDWGSLRTRIDRFDTEYAWSEDPPSRTRRFVSNVRVKERSADGAGARVDSNLLLFRSQGDTADSQLIAAERQDRLARTDAGWTLTERLVLLEHTILPMRNLSLFL